MSIVESPPHSATASLLTGSLGEAKITKKLSTTNEYTVYLARLQEVGKQTKAGTVVSDRPNLNSGDIVPVFYRRDDEAKMLIIELFAPWVRSLWLLVASLAALGLGLRERDKVIKKSELQH